MPRAGTKQALLISLLDRAGGASIRELANSTGWKPNTIHSALSTLRATGCSIQVDDLAKEKRYQIKGA